VVELEVRHQEHQRDAHRDAAGVRAVTGVKLHFWRDGANRSWAQTVRVETRSSSGTWVAASGEVTVTAGELEVYAQQ
jgi:hypothetical protein